jgi:hypothetical protein
VLAEYAAGCEQAAWDRDQDDAMLRIARDLRGEDVHVAHVWSDSAEENLSVAVGGVTGQGHWGELYGA